MNGYIIHGDCIEEMRKMPDKSFDLVLTDPPYNAKNIGPHAKVYAEGTMQLPIEEYKQWCADWFEQAMRVGKTVIFTPGIANVCYYPQPDWIVCWHKPAAVSFNRFGGFNAWEPIMVYGKMAKGKRLGQDYILMNTLNFTRTGEREHPCPKPPDLMKLLVDRFCPEGGVVLDPMCGSGTTLVAANALGHEWVGIDKVKRYVTLSKKRMDSVSEPMFKV